MCRFLLALRISSLELPKVKCWTVNGHMHQGRKDQDLEEYIENASISNFLFYEIFIFRPHFYVQRRIVRYEEHIRCIEDHCLNCMEHVSPSI